jgi:phosphoribosylformimino-5-aminoimidazole carboxamide ribonucleotide (ProFAR) isomerase
MLGPGNEEAAREALAAWPGGLQVGGGITDQNAGEWIERGAEKVIISYSCDTLWCYRLFESGVVNGSFAKSSHSQVLADSRSS